MLSKTDRQALVRIRDLTDKTGGAKYPSCMEPQMKSWERAGLIERHYVGANIPCARITDAGRAALSQGGGQT